MILGRIATFTYALALRAFPQGHRSQCADEMIDTFKSELAARRRAHGGMPALRFTVAAGLDAVSAGLGERRYRRQIGRLQRQGGAMRIGMSWLDVKVDDPTFLLRGGRSLHVPPRDPRGVRVASGDEIQLGRAIVSVTIADGPSA